MHKLVALAKGLTQKELADPKHIAYGDPGV
jgi:hypothetical protein